jgi:hypothetical protein
MERFGGKVTRLKSPPKNGGKKRSFPHFLVDSTWCVFLDFRTALSVSAQDIENISHDGNHNIATG